MRMLESRHIVDPTHEDITETLARLRDDGMVAQIPMDGGHMLIAAVTHDYSQNLPVVDHYEVRTKGSSVEDDTSKRDGLWVYRELDRADEFDVKPRDDVGLD